MLFYISEKAGRSPGKVKGIMSEEAIKYIDRTTGRVCTETVMGDGALRFAYQTLLGRSLWGILFGGRFFSALMGKYYDSAMSAAKIETLANIPGCRSEEAEFPLEHYDTFNEFFARRLKPGSRPVPEGEGLLLSPADARLTVFHGIAPIGAVPVKGALRTISELCRRPLPERCHVAVFRLAPVDYHRFHYPCSCEQESAPELFRGRYHSVNPVALKRHPEIFVENTRQITQLVSPEFGTFYQIEVGAFGVGSIVQTSQPGSHAANEEKGYFKFGGSTVILVMPAERAVFDADLVKNSAAGVETLVRCGMKIGNCLR